MGDADNCENFKLDQSLIEELSEKNEDEELSLYVDDGMYEAACLSLTSLDQIYKEKTTEVGSSLNAYAQADLNYVTASSKESVYGTAYNDEKRKSGSICCNSYSTIAAITSFSQTGSLCNILDTPLLTTSRSSDEGSDSVSGSTITGSSSGTDSSSTDNKKSNAGDVLSSCTTLADSRYQLISSIFKKDGRVWLHKSSKRAKYGLASLVFGKYKKDSRIWLHKKSRNRKLFTTLSDRRLYELINYPMMTRLEPCFSRACDDLEALMYTEHCWNTYGRSASQCDILRDNMAEGDKSNTY